jgi:hypothetical protein
MNSTSRFVPLVLGFVVNLLLAAGSTALAADRVRVAGTVLDAVTGQPLSSAMVRVTDASGTTRQTVTDKHGRYSMLGIESGRVSLDAVLARHLSEMGSISISPGDSATCNFRLGTRGGITVPHAQCRRDPNTVDKYTI